METKVVSRVMSTAGAVPVRNEKGELRMEKVKVARYISGKIPEYARGYDSDSDSYNSESEPEEEYYVEPVKERSPSPNASAEDSNSKEKDAVHDRRLARLLQRSIPSITQRYDRIIEEPEVIQEGNTTQQNTREDDYDRAIWGRRHIAIDSDLESDDQEEDETAIDNRRELMRKRAEQRQEEELLDIVEEDEEKKFSEESSEYEEYSDSEDDLGPRLKPVFVRKSDRTTIQEQELEEEIEQKKEREKKMVAERRKKESTRMLAAVIAHDLKQEQGVDDIEDVVNTDDENEEEEYEAWKIRELQRIKRTREEAEARIQEQEEMEKVRNMSEDERLSWLKHNPKHVTNKQEKGKYKFLQKYYHRGVFYLDEEDEIFKRNFAEPTLEDHYDKTVLPAVMQVKDFGRAGRTKYTHLVDQDTTAFDGAWSEVTPINLKYQAKGGGAREQFTKPSAKKQKMS